MLKWSCHANGAGNGLAPSASDWPKYPILPLVVEESKISPWISPAVEPGDGMLGYFLADPGINLALDVQDR